MERLRPLGDSHEGTRGSPPYRRHCEEPSCPPKPAFGRRRMRRSNPSRRAKKERVDCFVASTPRNDVVRFRFQISNRRYASAISRHGLARGLRFVVPPKIEGAGNAGCALHPRSRVQNRPKNCTRAYRAAEAIRHSLRNGFTAYIALTPEYRAFLPPSPRENWHVGPVGLSHLRKDLTPTIEASDPHDFAVRFGAVHLRAVDRSRETRPAITCLARRCRVHRIPSRVNDDHDTPLKWDRMARFLEVICPTPKAKICPSGRFAAATTG
jgi:hypothetical protein